MDNLLADINWIATGIIGVITSILGAFFYATFGKLIVRTGKIFRHGRIKKLKKEKEFLNKLNNSSSQLLIFCFKNLFYILVIFALANASIAIAPIFPDPIFFAISTTMWIASLYVGINTFSTLARLSNFDKY